jgi:hypothetical protein
MGSGCVGWLQGILAVSGTVREDTTKEHIVGTDGKMAETLETLGTGDSSGATKIGKGKKVRRKPAVKSGAERLRSMADRQVGRNSKKLTDLLTRNALAGSMASTRMLVGLAERKKPDAVKKRRGPSQALELANEQQWEGPDWEGD